MSGAKVLSCSNCGQRLPLLPATFCSNCGKATGYKEGVTSWPPKESQKVVSSGMGVSAVSKSELVGDGRKYDPSRLGKVLVWALRLGGLLIATSGFSLAYAHFKMMNLLESRNPEVGLSYWDWMDRRDTLSVVNNVVVIGVFLIVGVMFASWLYQRRSEVDSRGLLNAWGPGWAWGAWFVPVLSFFVPYLMVRDIYRVYTTPNGSRLYETKLGSIILWWVPFLIGGLTFNIFNRQESNLEIYGGESLTGLLNMLIIIGVVSAGAYLVSALAGASMVRSIEHERSHAEA